MAFPAIRMAATSARRAFALVDLPIVMAVALVWLSLVARGDAQVAGATNAAAGTNLSASAGLLNDLLRERWAGASHWDVGGQFRLRYENQDNAGSFPSRDFIRSGQANDNDFLFTRVRVHVGYTPESWLQFYVEGRDSRAFWDQRIPSPYYDRHDLHQFNVLVGDAKQFPLTLKVGRQELLYGDERFVSPSDWNNVLRVFDGAKLRYEAGKLWVDAFVSRVVLPNDERVNEPNFHDWFSGVYASSPGVVPWQDTDLYFFARNVDPYSYNLIAQGVHAIRPRDVYFIGTRWKSLPDALRGWDYTLELQGQFGSVNNTGTQRLRQQAYGVFGKAGYTWAGAWGKPRLGLGYEGGSGDGNPNDGQSGTFENLFGAPHRFYGLADLVGARNSHIPRVSAALRPTKDLSLTADYLWFWLADTHDYFYPETTAARTANGYGLHPGFNSFVGSEFDVAAVYKYKTRAEFQTGYGHFFVGDYIRESVGAVPANGGAVDAQWFYVQMKLFF